MDSFDHMDVTRKSLGEEKCKLGPGSNAYPSIFLASTASGWLHSNSLNYIHGSGDLLISIPEQDWVVKIDYKDGKGTGKVLWRLGLEGDFKVKSDDPYPWFSYPYDVGFDPPGSNRLIVFDDGDRRIKKVPKSNNRGQVWELDEQAMTATLVLNADLGCIRLPSGPRNRSPAAGLVLNQAWSIRPLFPAERPSSEQTARLSTRSSLTALLLIAVSACRISILLRAGKGAIPYV
jgi:hypothetical protein